MIPYAIYQGCERYSIPNDPVVYPIPHNLHLYAGVARFITQAEVGLWSIMTASTTVFTTLTLLGLPVATRKYVSENWGRRDLGVRA